MNEAQARSALLAALRWPAWLGWVVVILAFLFGIASDAIGAAHRINILAPPLLLMLCRNLTMT